MMSILQCWRQKKRKKNLWNFTKAEGRCESRTFMEFCHVSTFRQERKLKKGRFLKQIDCWLSFCFLLPFLYASIHQPACRSVQSCPVYTKCFASKSQKGSVIFFLLFRFLRAKTNIFDCVRTEFFHALFAGHHHLKSGNK